MQEKTQKVKTKVRFTSLDIAAMVAELQALVGLRVSNIYDINPTTYIFKIAKSQQKHHLLIENGVRFHLTEDKPDKKNIPSGFTMKFRKFLRSKRVESVRQVGVERVVVFTFGSQNFTNHLILQLYSQGNIILTDQQYRIVQCIRSHQFSQKIKTAVGQIYPFQQAANLYIQNLIVNKETIQKHLTIVPQPNNQNQNKKKSKQQKGGIKLKDIVFKLIPCLFPQFIQHLLTANNLDPDAKVQGQPGQQLTLNAGNICLKFLKQFIGKKQKGWLYSKNEEYFEFCPYQNCKMSKWPAKISNSFGESVAEYFLKYKRTAHEQQQAFEQIAWKKYEQIKKDQQQRVKKLIQQQQTFGGKAQLIQKNVQEVQAVLKILRTMQGNGYSWQAMERMIAQSRKTGDPLANMIHSLNAVKRQITVLLSDQDSSLCALTPVELNIDFNAYTNATVYYQSKKKQQQKQNRTRQASEQVLKIAEKDALKKIQKKKNQIMIKAVPTRKQLWFQKFYWFVTSDGWLVISGRDSHQNQLLVKRYMKPGDLYMHSDYGGAASTIIKGPPKAGLAPVSTLQQAAIFTVCRSKAWDTKIISSAWWVYHDQVSKSAPTGEFLPTGSFMIRGKRNFIHPNRMQMGLTLLFKLDNESMQKKIEREKILKGQQDKEKMQNNIPQAYLQNKSSQGLQSQQFAIIDLEAEARMAKQKKKQRGKKPQKINKTSETKQKQVQQQKQSDQQDDEDSDEQQKKVKTQKKQQKKKGSKNVKNQPEQPQQKHKNRNKKKLKKLQKYLEQQDEDQRQIIMKMLGAKQMKHIQPVEEQTEKVNEKSKNKKDKDKKKGIQKYISLNNKQEVNIDTDKVLFLKDKKKKEEQSQEEQIIQQKKQIKQVQKILKQQNNQNKNTEINNQQIQNNQLNNQNIQNKQSNQQINDSDQDEQVPVQQQKQKIQEQVDQKLMESQLSQLLKLTGKKYGNDKWQALIPMCAPYQTIKDNKFKVKLVPGGLKKGKAARNVLGYFTTGQLQQNQKAFVRALPEQQIINAIIGNVKLAGAGLLKIEQKSKAQKKQKRKQQDKKKAEVE